jgi:hypothetical protein
VINNHFKSSSRYQRQQSMYTIEPGCTYIRKSLLVSCLLVILHFKKVL